MSNLLPEENQKKLAREYRARFMLAGSFLSIGIAAFAALALSPSFGVLLVTRPAAVAQASEALQSKNEAADIARAQLFSAQLSPIASATSSISQAILQALSDLPPGVHVESITYMTMINLMTPTPTLSISGLADTREAMDKYRAALQADTKFSSVKLPVGDLIGVQGGRFTLTISGKF